MDDRSWNNLLFHTERIGYKPGKTGMSKTFWIIIGLFALLGIYGAFNSLIIKLQTPSWSTVEGKIIESSYQSHPGGQYSIFMGWDLNIRYTYDVGGGHYESNNFGGFAAGSCTTEEKVAREIKTKFYPGGRIIVYYDPKNPNESVLIPGATWRDWAWPIIIVVLPSLAFVRYRWYQGYLKRKEELVNN